MSIQMMWRIKCDNVRPHSCRQMTKPYRSQDKAEQVARQDGWEQRGGLWWCPFHAENSPQARAAQEVGTLFDVERSRRPASEQAAQQMVARVFGTDRAVVVSPPFSEPSVTLVNDHAGERAPFDPVQD